MSPGLRSTRSWLAGCSLIVACVCLSAVASWGQSKGLSDLAGPLRVLAQDAAAGKINTMAASRLGVKTRGNQVQVEVRFSSEAAAAATGLGKYGGQTQIRRDRRVEAMVPVDQLLSVASLPQVTQVSVPKRFHPLQQGFGATVSEGVQLTNATAMHAAGNLGQGVSVAVIDTGFAELTAAEVPVLPAAVVDLRADTTTVPTSAHGTAVAQIVADMAPACNMTLILVDTDMSIEAAADYAIAQKVQVVNMSLGADYGPFDGSDPVSQAVDRARAAGIFWVNAAGNEAQRHWQGTWQDTNGDTYMEFTGSKDFLSFDLTAGAVFEADLSWFETAGPVTDRDYDLVLVDATGNVTARSAITQNGNDPPQETLIAYIALAGNYHLRIQRMPWSAIADPPDKFQLYTPEYDIESSLQHPEDSLAIPAVASGAFAVGATRATSYLPATGPLAGLPVDRIEPFSSRGAIGDSSKPEMVAPDAVSIGGTTAGLAALNPFLGTSAAAPHLAGAAALLISEDQSRTPAILETLLKLLAVKIQPPAIPDTDVNAYGAGRLSLRVGSRFDAAAPVITIEFPANNSTISIASPRVVATFTDNSGIDQTTAQIWLDKDTTLAVQLVKDGVVVPGTSAHDFTFDAATGTVGLAIDNLTRTRHSLTMQVADTSGNLSALTTSNFRISTQTISAGLHIIGLPYPDLATADPSQVFGVPITSTTLPPMSLLRWVPSDSRPSKYHLYPDQFASFSPPDQLVAKPPAGLGYFLNLPSTGTLNIAASSLTDASYNIRLVYGTEAPRGWNLIGNPYEDYVDWGSVEFISANGRQDLAEAINPDQAGGAVTEGVLFDLVPTAGGAGYYYSFPSDPAQDTLEPLKGYWVHVLKDATLVVHNTGNLNLSARQKRQQAKAPAITAQNWTLQLQARAGKYEDPCKYIGVSAKATDGFDVGLDVSEPPPLVDTLHLYMPASTGNLAKDVRGALRGTQEWKVEVACRLKDVPVTISWPQLNATAPRDVTLRLEDLDTGQSVYMRTATGYTFMLAEPGVRHLRVTASGEAAASLAVTSLAAAEVRGGGAVLTYSVTRASDVSAEIRNMSGVLIRTLGQQSVVPGTTQALTWNGQSDRGVKAPAGKYFARVTARAADGQTVQAIRPFIVTH